MAADIVLHDDRVEVTGGDLRVNGAAVIAPTLGTGLAQMSGAQVRVGRHGATAGTITVHARAAAGGTSIIGGRTQTVQLHLGRPRPSEGNVRGANGTLRVFNQNAEKATITLTAAGLVKANVVNAVRVVETSDARCKTDVRPLDGSALERVMALRAVAFRWHDDPETPPETTGAWHGRDEIGFIAQEVEQVLPEVVAEGDDGLLGMSYASVVPVLTEAVKEQQRLIEELQERLARLES